MSEHVYNDPADKIVLAGGWEVSSRDVGLKNTDYNHMDTGLKSALYERTVNGKTEYSYVTAGTEENYEDAKADR